MTEERRPHGVDPHIPNVARMYDYYLGGKDNFAVDRETAEMVLKVFPEMKEAVRQGRALIGRVVEYLVEQGIRQFIDLGSGLPTGENVHEIARRFAPDARVVYVDSDDVVCAHGRALLAQPHLVAMVQADIRRPEEVLDSPEVRELIDLDRPVGVLLMATLHLVPDEDHPEKFMARYRDALAPGSYLAISHAGIDSAPETFGRVADIYRGANQPFRPRSGKDILRFFGDFELIEPGLVAGAGDRWPFAERDPLVPLHEALSDPIARSGYVGIARKP